MSTRTFCDLCGNEMSRDELADAERDDWGSREPQLSVCMAGYGYVSYEHVCRPCRDGIRSYLESHRPSAGEDC